MTDYQILLSKKAKKDIEQLTGCGQNPLIDRGIPQSPDPPKPPLKRGALKPPLLQGGVWGGSAVQLLLTTPQLTGQQKSKLQEILLQVIATTPYAGKQLKGQLAGLYSYRLTRKDRIVYEIIEDDKVVFVIRARSHYGE